jgi:ficolin
MRNILFWKILPLLALGAISQAALFPNQKVNEVGSDFKEHFSLSSFKDFQSKFVGNYADCFALRAVNQGLPGIYNIYINGTYKPVRCYYNGTKAYTIIQQRVSGNVDFNRRLSDYANGFGSVAADHWLGLNTIRHLVELGNNQLQIVMTSWPPSQQVVATYGYFSIGTQQQGWPLSVGNYYGSVPDDLSYSNGRVFYTSDVPDPNNCAVNQRGGWWYNYCSYAFLNGYYYRTGKYTPPGNFYDGIYWKDWLGYDYSLMQVTMAVTHS